MEYDQIHFLIFFLQCISGYNSNILIFIVKEFVKISVLNKNNIIKVNFKPNHSQALSSYIFIDHEIFMLSIQAFTKQNLTLLIQMLTRSVLDVVNGLAKLYEQPEFILLTDVINAR